MRNLASIFAVATLAAAPVMAANWAITDLGAGVVPFDINNSGTVLHRRFIHDGIDYFGEAINNSGQILAQPVFGGGPVLINGGTVTQLQPAGMEQAYGLNDAGHVAGRGCTPQMCGAAIFDGVTFQLVGTSSFWHGTFGTAINNGGSVALFRDTGAVGATVHGFLVTAHGVSPFGLGGHTFARAISELGDVVGSSHNSWNMQRAFLYSGGATVDLGTLGGLEGDAFDINEHGAIVGWADKDPFVASRRAFIWQGGQMADLTELSDAAAAGWDWLDHASGINDNGQIVGYGFRNGVLHGFLLSPVPEPATAAMLLAGLGALLLARQRRPVKPNGSRA